MYYNKKSLVTARRHSFKENQGFKKNIFSMLKKKKIFNYFEENEILTLVKKKKINNGANKKHPKLIS